MAITARLDGTPESVVHDDVGEFWVCRLVFEDEDGRIVGRHEHRFALHERVWTEEEMSEALGHVARARIEGYNMARAQSLDPEKVAVKLNAADTSGGSA